MNITVRPVSGLAGTKKFIKLQWKFYEGDRNWPPPLIMDRKKLLNTKKNPFFRHSDIQLFIAERNGEAVGRIAAITNDNHNKTHNDKTGFFGFFESINVQEVANALFDAAAKWLQAKGMDTMRGPMNPSINDEIGMLIDGFDRPPVVLMTYNPRYYPLLVEGHGFKKAKDIYAYLLKHDDVLTPKLERGQQLVRERYGIEIRNIDFRDLARESSILKDLYNRIWEANWGAVAMTDAEFDFLVSDLKQVIGPFKDMVFYLIKNDEPVGFALFLPDLNQVFIHNSNGATLPGVYHLLTKTKRIDIGRIIALGVLPQYRGKGFDSVMYYEVLRRAAAHNIFLGEASWVLEDNDMMNRGAKLMNADRYKTYRLYDISI